MLTRLLATAIATSALIAANARANFNLDEDLDGSGDDLHLLVG